MQPATVAVAIDLSAGPPLGLFVLSATQLTLVVAVGSAALVVCAPILRVRQHRSARRTRCVHCGAGRTRGEPPLLSFRGAGRWCTHCIRTAERPIPAGRPSLATPETVDNGCPPSIRATLRDADPIQEVSCHVAA